MEIHLEEKYRPTEKQEAAHSAKERYVLYGGAMRGGKTGWGVNEIIQLCIDYPGNRTAIYRWEHESLQRTTLLTLEEYLHPALIAKHHKVKKQQRP